MKNFPIFKIIVITSFVFVVMVALGSLTIHFTSANSDNFVKAKFPKNANGQTYGSDSDVRNSEEGPDLIEAYGVAGNIGYVLKKDLEGDRPKSPEEAVAMEKKKVPGSISYIPLYEADGKTVIGKFKIQNSGGPTIKK
ncbi:hypothetical protein [Paenibacillus eucommiae]|uniref:Membrane protein YkoI n=1 Tax=Paenibacillus eucommiae TaxID=1355755 RepID=A0ABS4IUE8_9BACL|nr:hypothetical protein [Paenibacillus eucommiae]MBP1991208.1 putative membrane protein YkoI [Paenibacillus eucommiae]